MPVKTILIVDQDYDYEPSFFVTVPSNVTAEAVQDVIYEVKNKFPGEYDEEDLAEALHEAFGYYPHKINPEEDVVCW